MGISFQTQGQQGNLLLQYPQQQGFAQSQVNPAIFGFQGQQPNKSMMGPQLDRSDPYYTVIQSAYEKMAKIMNLNDKTEFIRENP